MNKAKYSFGLSFPEPRDMVVRAEDARKPTSQYWSERVLSIEISGGLDSYSYPWSREFDEVEVKFRFYEVPAGREVGSVEAVKFSDDETGKRYNMLNVELILAPHMFSAISQSLSTSRRSNQGVMIYLDENPSPWAEQEDPPLLNIEKFKFMSETLESYNDAVEEKPITTVGDEVPPLWWQRRHAKTKKMIERISSIIVTIFIVIALINWLSN